jgi:alkylated DNA repair dioxygenase AlkB
MSSISSIDEKKEAQETPSSAGGGDAGKIKAARAREEQEEASGPEDIGAAAAAAAEAPPVSKKAKAVRILRKATAKQARAAAEQRAAADALFSLVTFDGVAIPNLEHVVLDTFVIPNFLSTHLGMDPVLLFEDLQERVLWTSPSDRNMLYRGHELLRQKGFLVTSPDSEPFLDQEPSVLRKYSYPGFQNGSFKYYRDMRTVPQVNTIVQENKKRLRFDGAPVDANHAILTRYRDEDDNIGFHADKTKDITPNTSIVSLSLGESREMHFVAADPNDSKVTVKKRCIALNSGDLCIMGPETNAKYLHSIVPVICEEVIKRDPGAEVKPRISIVFRDISKVITREKAREKAAKTEAGRKVKEREKELLATVPTTAGKKTTTKKGGHKRGSSPSEVDNDDKGDADDANVKEQKDDSPSKPEVDPKKPEVEIFVIRKPVLAAANAPTNKAAATVAKGPWSLLESPNGVLSNGGHTCVKLSEDLWTCATSGTVGWSSGVHQWDVRLDRLAKGIVIGIARADEGIIFVGSDASNAPLRLGLLCNTGHVAGMDNQDRAYLNTAVPTGATVSVHLDLDRKTVSFTLKGTNAAAADPAFSNLGEGEWYPYFAMRFKDCTFTVIPK